MRQVLQSGLLGQVFLLWLNLSSSIQNVPKADRNWVRYDGVPLITASHEAPWQKPRGWEHRGDQQLSRRSRSRDRASLGLRVPGCPAGLRRSQTHKEQPCAHVNTLYCASRRQSCSLFVISSNNVPVDVLPIIIQRSELFHRRRRESEWRRCLPCCVRL